MAKLLDSWFSSSAPASSAPAVIRTIQKLPPQQQYRIYAAAGAASLGSLLLLRCLLNAPAKAAPAPIPSPKKTVLPNLSPDEIDVLPYPPDALPGARDVKSPYGTTRVYEFGPEDGEQILLIHGISTPSIALSDLAHRLVRKGCRVMLFDLFGRGYSGAPDPTHFHYDSSLYTTQILTVLQSSPIAWGPFTLVGYSLGGALAADFTSYFPNMIKGLVLIAPGGIIRTRHITLMNRLMYSSGLLPEWMVAGMVGRRLRTGTPSPTEEEDPEAIERAETASVVSFASTSTRRTKAVFLSSDRLLLSDNPYSTVSAVVDWQVANHPAFVPAFISTIRHGPIHNQHARWTIIREHIERRKGVHRESTHSSSSSRHHDKDDKKKKSKKSSFFDKKKSSWGGSSSSALEKKKGNLTEVWIVLGETDPIIVKDEIVDDASEVLGEANVRFRIVGGTGHEVGIERADEVVDVIGRAVGGL